MRRPRSWLAALLTVLLPGLGHFYTGRIALGVSIVLALELLIVPAGILAMQRSPGTALVALGLLAPIGLIALVVHAARVARQPTRRFLSGRAVFWVCVAFFMGATSVSLVSESVRHRYLGQALRIPSSGMQPTLLIGDHFYSNAWAYRTGTPQRGDVVIVRVAHQGSAVYPADHRPDLATELFIKRVVGLPGDTLRFRGSELTVNGQELTGSPSGNVSDSEGRQLLLRTERLGASHYHVLDDPSLEGLTLDSVVEPGRYFLAGDNRSHSYDSRHWGTVRRDEILGSVSKIYWSWNFHGPTSELAKPNTWLRLLRNETRWERIGLLP